METLTFSPGQTTLITAVSIIDDNKPEETESFLVSMTRPTGGAELGDNNTLEILILTNDEAYGIVVFAQVKIVAYVH